MPSRCMLLYHFGDYLKNISLVDKGIAEGERGNTGAAQLSYAVHEQKFASTIEPYIL